jgi:hypothetical protein
MSFGIVPPEFVQGSVDSYKAGDILNPLVHLSGIQRFSFSAGRSRLVHCIPILDDGDIVRFSNAWRSLRVLLLRMGSAGCTFFSHFGLLSLAKNCPELEMLSISFNIPRSNDNIADYQAHDCAPRPALRTLELEAITDIGQNWTAAASFVLSLWPNARLRTLPVNGFSAENVAAFCNYCNGLERPFSRGQISSQKDAPRYVGLASAIEGELKVNSK